MSTKVLEVREIQGVAGFTQLQGQHIGHSPWRDVGQLQVNRFGDVTLDRQWPHVDVERARNSIFGGTIAHGFLTLSLLQSFFEEIFQAIEFSTTLNYGLNKVRFPNPVLVGSSIRLGVQIADVKVIDGGVEVVLQSILEIKDVTKPGMVAEVVLRYYV